MLSAVDGASDVAVVDVFDRVATTDDDIDGATVGIVVDRLCPEAFVIEDVVSFVECGTGVILAKSVVVAAAAGVVVVRLMPEDSAVCKDVSVLLVELVVVADCIVGERPDVVGKDLCVGEGVAETVCTVALLRYGDDDCTVSVTEIVDSVNCVERSKVGRVAAVELAVDCCAGGLEVLTDATRETSSAVDVARVIIGVVKVLAAVVGVVRLVGLLVVVTPTTGTASGILAAGMLVIDVLAGGVLVVDGVAAGIPEVDVPTESVLVVDVPMAGMLVVEVLEANVLAVNVLTADDDVMAATADGVPVAVDDAATVDLEGR